MTICKSRCRLRAGIAHPGQILLGDDAAQELGTKRPVPGTLVALGPHRLADLNGAERVWQLSTSDGHVEFDPLPSLDTHRHNLPVQLTPLIGRDREISAISGLPEPERLVTLTGAGGVGKTRLGLAVASHSVDRFPNGTWWADLASLSEPEGLTSALFAACATSEVPGRRPMEALIGHLAQGPRCLVLDNCEHLLGEAGSVASELLVERVIALGDGEDRAQAIRMRWNLLHGVDPLEIPAVTSVVRASAHNWTRQAFEGTAACVLLFLGDATLSADHLARVDERGGLPVAPRPQHELARHRGPGPTRRSTAPAARRAPHG